MKRHTLSFFGLDAEGDGFEFDDFVTALGLWVALQPTDEPNTCTVAEAMDAFNVSEEVVDRAVEEHEHLDIVGDQIGFFQ